MKISHEVPLSLLEASREFNDYDYALVHLFETEPTYYNFFEESLKQGRKVILDNSIFELGTAFDPVEYAVWISKLKPTEYIIPDVLENALGTMDNALEWKETQMANLSTNSKAIGVVQGKSYEELVQCYQYLDEIIGVDKLAISFDYSYYKEVFPHPNKWVSFCLGRVLTLSKLLQDGIINKDKPHHLLGCSLPQEFMYYQKGFEWIESLDTSNPVVHGILGVIYDNGGLMEKQSIKLVELLKTEMTRHNYSMILYNVDTFRSFVTCQDPLKHELAGLL